MSGKLYVVGTPIGNLSDFSPRGIKTLEEVDFIAAEDTRVTLKLLNHFEIKKELVSYFEHNKKGKGEFIINRILSGESAAVVSDAGMPAISDPGEELVALAHQNGIEVESVPGPSAFVTALSISGMDCRRFCFEGFLPIDKVERKEALSRLRKETRTMVFYEAPHKLKQTLKDFSDIFEETREIAIVKEITKLHETVLKTTLFEALKYFEDNAPRGEYVIILAGAKEEEREEISVESAVLLAKKFIEEGMSVSAAAKAAAEETGIRKNEIYRSLI